MVLCHFSICWVTCTLHYIFLTRKLSNVEEKILMANKNRLTVELIPTTFTK